MLLPLLLVLIAGENVPPAKPEVSVKVEEGVKVTDGQIEEVTALAKKAYIGEIERVCVTQFRHPGGSSLEFHVEFKDEIVDRYVIRRYFRHYTSPTDRPGKDLRKPIELPQKVDPKYLVCSVGRLFKLKQTEVRCDLGDGLSYDLAERVLLSVEAKNYEVQPRVRFDILEEGVDLSKVIHVDCDPKTKRIEVRISRGTHAFSVYGFEVHGESFELVAVDHWY